MYMMQGEYQESTIQASLMTLAFRAGTNVEHSHGHSTLPVGPPCTIQLWQLQLQQAERWCCHICWKQLAVAWWHYQRHDAMASGRPISGQNRHRPAPQGPIAKCCKCLSSCVTQTHPITSRATHDLQSKASKPALQAERMALRNRGGRAALHRRSGSCKT